MRDQLSERLDHLLASVHKSGGSDSEADARSASPCAPQVAVDGVEAHEERQEAHVEAEGQPPRRMARPITTVDLSGAREAECGGGSAAAAVALAHNGHAEQCEQRAAATLDE